MPGRGRGRTQKMRAYRGPVPTKLRVCGKTSLSHNNAAAHASPAQRQLEMYQLRISIIGEYFIFILKTVKPEGH